VAIDKQFVVNLKGRDVPLYAGVLDAATKAGLKSLTTELLQIPGPENGHTAIVMATATFDDGRVFSDVGDASPANTSPQIATAAIRMASTRAKGRALRDAVNCGMALREELPDDEEQQPARGRQAAPQAQQRNGSAHSPQSAPIAPQSRSEAPAMSCSECGAGLTASQQALSVRKYDAALCPVHQREAAKHAH
jgi:hypothetical protein